MNGADLVDLALENFPALPSPNSPNESGGSSSANRSASSLKVFFFFLKLINLCVYYKLELGKIIKSVMCF